EYANTSAAALLAYDVAHHAPWDWRVSLYTWTKGIAAGVYLVALLLLVVGGRQPRVSLARRPRRPARRDDGDLHRVLVRAGQGARSVAEPAPAAAPRGPGRHGRQRRAAPRRAGRRRAVRGDLAGARGRCRG